MDVKQAINEIKRVLAAFAAEKAEAPATPELPAQAETAAPASEGAETAKEETPAVEAPAPEAPAEGTTESPVALEAATPDLGTIQAEIEELRKRVSTLDEYVYLKEANSRLEEQVTKLNAGFETMQKALGTAVEAMQFMADLPTADPVQKPKDGIQRPEKKRSIEKFFI
jgi:hypothetical protein